MFMVTDDENADPTKGYLARGNMNDLQVWLIETILNKDADIAPYVALVALTTISGLVGHGLPIDEEVLRGAVLEAGMVTEEVKREAEEEEGGEDGSS